MTEIVVPAHEMGTARLFSGEFPNLAALKAYALPGDGGWPMADEMGADLDPGRVEAFLKRDLGEYGLAGYLEEGLGVPLERLADAPLDEVGEAVIVLHPRALGEGGGTVKVPGRLTFHGAFAEDGWQPGPPPALPRAETGPPPPAGPPDTPEGRGGMPGWVWI
ncbi:MAG: hypothetical protein ACU0BS_06815, partial [Hasllibacter sp.]